MTLARLFPASYLLLWFPAALLGQADSRYAIALAAILLAVLADRTMARRFGLVAGLAVFFYALLSGLVNAASCSAASVPLGQTLFVCAARGAVPAIGLIAALLSVAVMAIANEWRGSLVCTVNGLTLPRDVKVVSAIAGSLIGEFRRANLRVHHATTAQGVASPRRSLRNLIALPQLAAAAWASVLSAVAQRLRHQWSSEAFWDCYFPRECTELRRRLRDSERDAVVLAIGIAALSWAVWAMLVSRS